ncbi:MAG: integrase family protein [Candidatus Obscuribacterales bacterium]|nr:integrase family protein [Candidatus Obscuribacterales bacterium]
MPKLTKLFISNIKPPDKGQVIYRDSALPGLGLRVTPKSMSYIAEGRVNGAFRRVTLGKEWQLTPTEARKKAKKVIATLAAGKDPTAEKVKRKIRGATLREILNHFLQVRNLKPNSVRGYRNMIPRCLGDWLDTPVAAITREMVEQRHMSLKRTTKQGTTGEAQANTVMHMLGTLLNFAAVNYEIDGKPIILINPVKRLSNNRRWYPNKRRQTIVPDHKLAAWYNAVISLRFPTIRDYLLLLILTGLRKTEGATLRWEDIDFESKVLTIRAEIAKNGTEHRLPLSDFLFDLLHRRFLARTNCEFVFPGRGGKLPMVDSDLVIKGVGTKANCPFILHDLRRTFLTVAERLALSYVVLKKLANHSGKNDTTFGYVVVDVERLREPMQMITNEFVRMFTLKNGDQQESDE